MWTGRENQPTSKTIVYVNPKQRKDGKFSVTYCFIAKKIRKLETIESLARLAKSDSYQLIRQ